MADGEPVEPGPDDCCGEGCASCVWDVYREKLQQWQEAQANTTNIECNPAMSKIYFVKCILNVLTENTSDTSTYRFLVPNNNGSQLILKPGQHLEMRGFYKTEEEIIRKYSPIQWKSNFFDVIIKKYEDGKISSYLSSLKEGDHVEWRGPYGNFQYNSKDQNLLVILCAGTGIAPMLPIVRSIVEDSDDETVIKMLCGCHSLESRLLLPQLKELASFWNFSFVHYVNLQTGTPGWGESVVQGRITEDNVIHAVGSTQPDLCKVLVCGPEAFCLDMKFMAEKIGAKHYCF